MEKKGAVATSSPLGMCEKLFNALKIPTVRPLRRISYNQETVPATAARNTPAADSASKTGRAETKLPAPVKPEPAEVAKIAHVPEKKVTEAVPAPPPGQAPIALERAKQTQSTEWSATVASEIEPPPPLLPPPKLKLESAPPAAQSIGGQGSLKISAPLPTQPQVKEKASAKSERGHAVPLTTQAQVKEKATARAEGVEEGKTVKAEPAAAKPDKERGGAKAAIENINDRVVDYINRAKVKLRADSSVGMKEKATARAEGVEGKTVKAEPAAAKPDKERAGTKAAIENINDRVGDYINRAKVKLRADSSVGKSGKRSSGGGGSDK